MARLVYYTQVLVFVEMDMHGLLTLYCIDLYFFFMDICDRCRMCNWI